MNFDIIFYFVAKTYAMALPSTGAISMSQIGNEFDIAGAVDMSTIYKGGSHVAANTANTNIPTTGSISMSKFLGTCRSTFQFINAGLTGVSGPSLSQVQNSRYWAINSISMNASYPGIQVWTIPVTGTYTIVAAGAAGIGITGFVEKGAVMQGNFSLTANQQLKILVGQNGITSGVWAAGGGGSFVTQSDNTPLLIAGGGGGGNGTTYNGNAPTSTAGGNGATTAVGGGCANTQNSGGTGGNGGAGQGIYGGNAGGGGLLTNGSASAAGAAGYAFVNGGAGGTGYDASRGGFGGGGACSGNGGGHSGVRSVPGYRAG